MEKLAEELCAYCHDIVWQKFPNDHYARAKVLNEVVLYLLGAMQATVDCMPESHRKTLMESSSGYRFATSPAGAE